ncbi:MAG: hypothetical protein FWE22_02180 [Firmicutes bacterium]|nr:hypothetical protein [Bacillota bacterium]
MDLAKDILVKIIANETIQVKLSITKKEYAQMFSDGCYFALSKIRQVLKDKTLSHLECIEQIVCIFEQLGTDCGAKYDFDICPQKF